MCPHMKIDGYTLFHYYVDKIIGVENFFGVLSLEHMTHLDKLSYTIQFSHLIHTAPITHWG